MNMKAVGGYFEGLRLAREYSPAEVAVALKQRLGRNVSTSTVWKIEAGVMRPKIDLLLALIDVLRASVEDVWSLMQDEGASEAAGREMGRRAASVEVSEEAILGAWRRVEPSRRAAILAQLQAELG